MSVHGKQQVVWSAVRRPLASVWAFAAPRVLRVLARTGFSTPRNRSNVGKWDRHYANLDGERLYGDDTTYQMAAEFLKDCEVVEDWGCGSGGFRLFCKTRYVGIDGSKSPYADKVVDLRSHTSSADGILLRHVLEHNADWHAILDNAVASFRKRLCIVVYTPFEEKTRTLTYNPRYDVIELTFSKEDIIRHLDVEGLTWRLDENIASNTYYKMEHVFFVSRNFVLER